MRAAKDLHTTPEEVVPVTWRGLAAFVAASAGLVLVFVGASAKVLENAPMSGGSMRVFQKWRLMDLQDTPADWLILGDSSGDGGARPTVLEAELGGTVLNLCTHAPMLVVNDAWMLDEYVRRVGKPHNVVVVHVYDVWPRDVPQLLPMIHNIPRPHGYWREMQPAIDVPLAQELDLAVYHLLPPFAKRQVLREYVLSRFRTMPDPADVGQAVRTAGWNLRCGPRPEHVAKVAEAQARSAVSGRVPISDVNARAFDRLLAISKEHDIPLYFVAAPLYRGLYDDAHFRRTYDALADELRSRIRASGAPAEYVFDTPPLYEASDMETTDHVVGEGPTSDYSRQIARAIQTQSAAVARNPRAGARRD